jgi:hypothetical protein
MSDRKLARATSITYQTLLGTWGTPPLAHGNCFYMATDDGHEYRIVNFVLENLEALLAAGLTFPVDIAALDRGVAVIHDRRIPSEWYATRFCEVCCPQRLLPMPQTLRIEREIMQGVREEQDGCIIIHSGRPACLIDPTAMPHQTTEPPPSSGPPADPLH